MPLGLGKTDFTLDSAAPLEAIRCVKGPSKPYSPLWNGRGCLAIRKPPLAQLSFPHENSEREGAAALREMLELYAMTSERV